MSALKLSDISPNTELSVDDAVVLISAETRLTAQDVQDLMACRLESLQHLVQAYKDMNVMPEASTWDVVLKVLGMCVQVAAIVAPLAGAVSAVFGVVTAGKALA